MGLTQGDYAWSMHDSEQTIAQLLAPAGYQRWLLGLQHETPHPEKLGFEHVDLGFSLLDAPQHLEPLLRERDQDRPFYCQLGCFEAHRPFDWESGGVATEPDDALGVTLPIGVPDSPETRAEWAAFQGMVARFDRGLGRVLDLLDEHDLTKSTLVIVTTDHGVPFPLAKGTLLDAGVGVMCWLRWPERWAPGQRISALTSHLDILPTVLRAAQVTIPDHLHGRDLYGFMQW